MEYPVMYLWEKIAMSYNYIQVNAPSYVSDVPDNLRRGFAAPIGVELEDIVWQTATYTPNELPWTEVGACTEALPKDFKFGDFSYTETTRKTAILYCDSYPLERNTCSSANHSGTGTREHPFRNLNDALRVAIYMVRILCCVPVCIKISGIVNYHVGCIGYEPYCVTTEYDYSWWIPSSRVCSNNDSVPANESSLYAAHNIMLDFSSCTVQHISDTGYGSPDPISISLAGCTIVGLHTPTLQYYERDLSCTLRLKDAVCSKCTLNSCYMSSRGSTLYVDSVLRGVTNVGYTYDFANVAYRCTIIDRGGTPTLIAALHCTLEYESEYDDGGDEHIARFSIWHVESPVLNLDNATSVTISGITHFRCVMCNFSVDNPSLSISVGLLFNANVRCAILRGALIMDSIVTCDCLREASSIASEVTVLNQHGSDDMLYGNCVDSDMYVHTDDLHSCQFWDCRVIDNSTIHIMIKAVIDSGHIDSGVLQCTDIHASDIQIDIDAISPSNIWGTTFVQCSTLHDSEIRVNINVSEPLVKPSTGNYSHRFVFCGVSTDTAIDSLGIVELNMDTQGFETSCYYTRSEIITDICGINAESYSNCTSNKVLKSTCVTLEDEPRRLTSTFDKCVM